MKRREFITLLGGAAVVSWPARPRAEQRSKRLIGLLGRASPATSTPQIQAWVGGLRELGYVEGQDYEIVAKWAFGVMDRLPALAEELVQLKPDVIVAAPTPAVAELRTKTESIPIVSFMLARRHRPARARMQGPTPRARACGAPIPKRSGARSTLAAGGP